MCACLRSGWVIENLSLRRALEGLPSRACFVSRVELGWRWGKGTEAMVSARKSFLVQQ